MTDIGFGLINKRTVIIVLFVMVISVSFSNNQLPIGTSNAGEIFIDTVLFTGYLLLSRSVFRLPFAIGYSLIKGILIITPNILDEFIKYPDSDKPKPKRLEPRRHKNEEKDLKKTPKILRILIAIGISLIRAVTAVFLFILAIPFTLFAFGKWLDTNNTTVGSPSSQIDEEPFTKKTVKFLDRVGLILIAYLATLPYVASISKSIGEVGLIFAVIIFLFRGDFSFIVKDSIGEKDKEIPT